MVERQWLRFLLVSPIPEAMIHPNQCQRLALDARWVAWGGGQRSVSDRTASCERLKIQPTPPKKRHGERSAPPQHAGWLPSSLSRRGTWHVAHARHVLEAASSTTPMERHPALLLGGRLVADKL